MEEATVRVYRTEYEAIQYVANVIQDGEYDDESEAQDNLEKYTIIKGNEVEVRLNIVTQKTVFNVIKR